MGQTKAGAARARETRIKALMEQRDISYELAEVLYKEEQRMKAIMGGKKSSGGGFAVGEEGRRLAAIAGRKGGRRSAAGRKRGEDGRWISN